MFQRLLRVRVISFSTAVALHLGWALALSVLLVAIRRGLGEGKAPVGLLGIMPLVGFALVCAVGSAAVWGRRRQTVRWIRGLNDDDIAAALAAACTAAVSMTLIAVVAVGIPTLSCLLSRGETDALMAGALTVIGVLSISLGWILFEGLGGLTTPLPGKLEVAFAQPGRWAMADE